MSSLLLPDMNTVRMDPLLHHPVTTQPIFNYLQTASWLNIQKAAGRCSGYSPVLLPPGIPSLHHYFLQPSFPHLPKYQTKMLNSQTGSPLTTRQTPPSYNKNDASNSIDDCNTMALSSKSPSCSADALVFSETVTPKEAPLSASATPIRTSSRNRRPPAFIEGESTCPICGSLLRASELSEHFEKELKEVGHDIDGKSLSCKKRFKEQRTSTKYPDRKNSSLAESRKNVLARVRLNRRDRSTQITRKPPKSSPKTKLGDTELQSSTSGNSANSPSGSASVCPVCNQSMNCSTEELTIHVENCLNRQQQQSPSSNNQNSNSAASSDDEYETYTWCGETRIRATSLLDNEELAASGFNKVKKCKEDEEDMNLVVDDDDDQQYGGVQYTEADVIPCTSEEPSEAKAQSALRDAVIRSATRHDSGDKPTKSSKWTDDQTEESGEILRCLICMDKYTTPVVSVQCWHVHCEECWLRTLGAKKLCPQCNLITSPVDLRRIYL